MLRLIVRSHEAYPDGTTTIQYATFYIPAPAVEEFLQDSSTYCKRAIVGGEVVTVSPIKPEEPAGD